tara:strand:- start:1457 stop:1711 length:255 start_codon:yes stop_codon:yes gene_type:complete
MSGIKMSDVFVFGELHHKGSKVFDCTETGEFDCIAQAQAAVHAINSHDTLTARVAELEAAILAYKESGTTGNQHKMFELLEAKS